MTGCWEVRLEIQVQPCCRGLEYHPEEFIHQKAFPPSPHKEIRVSEGAAREAKAHKPQAG